MNSPCDGIYVHKSHEHLLICSLMNNQNCKQSDTHRVEENRPIPDVSPRIFSTDNSFTHMNGRRIPSQGYESRQICSRDGRTPAPAAKCNITFYEKGNQSQVITLASGSNLPSHHQPPLISFIAVGNSPPVPTLQFPPAVLKQSVPNEVPLQPSNFELQNNSKRCLTNPNFLQFRRDFLHPPKMYNKVRSPYKEHNEKKNNYQTGCIRLPCVFNNVIYQEHTNINSRRLNIQPRSNNLYMGAKNMNFSCNASGRNHHNSQNARPHVHERAGISSLGQDFTILKRQNGKVHIGGLLTLPKCAKNSQDGTICKGVIYKPVAQTFRDPLLNEIVMQGCQGIEKIVRDYSIKSSDTDIITFSKKVQASIASKYNTIHVETILRQLIIAFLHISSSWVSLSSILNLPREQAYLLGSLQHFDGIFREWECKSKVVLNSIMASLQSIPPNYEKFILQSFTSNAPSTSTFYRNNNAYNNSSYSRTQFTRKGSTFPPTKRHRQKKNISRQFGNKNANSMYKIKNSAFASSYNLSEPGRPVTKDSSDCAYFSESQADSRNWSSDESVATSSLSGEYMSQNKATRKQDLWKRDEGSLYASEEVLKSAGALGDTENSSIGGSTLYTLTTVPSENVHSERFDQQNIINNNKLSIWEKYEAIVANGLSTEEARCMLFNGQPLNQSLDFFGLRIDQAAPYFTTKEPTLKWSLQDLEFN